MTASPDESAKCRCGRSTYAVPGYDSLRTCSLCGYLTSYCKCRKESDGALKTGFRLPKISDRTRAMLGAGLVSSLGTLFFLTMLTSPFMAFFALGLPLGLTSAFFVSWLKGDGVSTLEPQIQVAPHVYRGPAERRGNTRE
ncbi:MAG: hypothetical protein KGI38_10910 [Thaumarchaeota archaeon]|nr:hypothetical protein [Nitrososphaerota archaeon]